MQPRISGTRDYVGNDAVSLRAAREKIEDAFRRYAYDFVEPPILERSSPFLDRSGEEIRRRMYIFADPGGRELCLRPELTIPACRAYLRQTQARGSDVTLSREARLFYVGPAFRYESTSPGRYRQFYQAGAELIGATQHKAADAEVMAVALDAVEAAGLRDAKVEVGDLGILNAFIDGLPIGPWAKTRLRRLALRNRKEERFLSAASAKEQWDQGGPTELGDLASFLSSVEPDKAELLIRQVLALADVRHVGGRTPEEIVQRLTSRSARVSADTVSTELLLGVSTLLSLRGDPAATFERVADHFKSFGIQFAVEGLLETCQDRLDLFESYRDVPAPIEFNVGLRRGLEYYTGFVFEIYSQSASQIGHVCGGGRYDDLLEALGANLSVPAVGFAIGLDRLLVALKHEREAPAIESAAPQALVVAAGAVRHEDCIRTSVALRKVGWRVQTETSGRRARTALAYALKRGIPYIVFVGEDEIKKGQIRVKRLSDREDRLVDLASIGSYVELERQRDLGSAAL